MANASHIKDLIRQAMAKQAAEVDTARNDEYTADVKAAIPASVDSQTASDATGRMAKDPMATIGTKAEASTDAGVDGLPKDSNDDQAFKSASDLRKLASQLLSAITKAAESAITVDAPQNAGTTPNTPDSKGTEAKLGDAKPDGAAAQTDKGPVQTAATSVAPEKDPAKSAGVLANEIYKLANHLLVTDDMAGICKYANVSPEEVQGDVTEQDIDGLEGGESDELASALQASATDAANEGTQDADNVGDYLSAYQEAPGVLGGEAGGGAGDPSAPAGDEQMDLDGLAQMLEESGITPEELLAALQDQGGAAPAPEAPVLEPVKEASWTKLSKVQKRKVVMGALKSIGGN